MDIKIIKFIYFVYIVIAIYFTYLLVLSTNLDSRLQKTEEWVAGQYGKYCYEENEMPGTIKKPVYFDSLDDCLKFISNKDL